MIKRKKRGSLALSMNAIVVLIMAIAMLGVGLGVVRMVAKKAETELTKWEAEVPEPPTATPGQRLTLSGEPVTGAPGDSRGIKLSFYPTADDHGEDITPELSGDYCAAAATFSEKKVTEGVPIKWTGIVNIPSGTAKGQYLCLLTVNTISEDIRIIVT